MQPALKETTDGIVSAGFIGIQSEGSDIEIRKIIYELAEMERRPRIRVNCMDATSGPPRCSALRWCCEVTFSALYPNQFRLQDDGFFLNGGG